MLSVECKEIASCGGTFYQCNCHLRPFIDLARENEIGSLI